MIDDAELTGRKAAYIDAVRALGRRARNAGFVACLLGVLMIIWARFAAGAPAILLWAGLAVIVAGWGLFVWSALKRAAFVRAHPFDAQE